ncbi:hypothetical protein SS50377_23335 [Spironucleus salmonicida]|uniref:Transmembrane protein n=1 Tax=Spironucleus salmonicida TaxID=348837 RepID=A0A9P8LWM9_9EUKA|nr:hypothetical protein SS50377_23335 [Spironucleus salmonicida]
MNLIPVIWFNGQLLEQNSKLRLKQFSIANITVIFHSNNLLIIPDINLLTFSTDFSFNSSIHDNIISIRIFLALIGKYDLNYDNKNLLQFIVYTNEISPFYSIQDEINITLIQKLSPRSIYQNSIIIGQIIPLTVSLQDSQNNPITHICNQVQYSSINDIISIMGYYFDKEVFKCVIFIKIDNDHQNTCVTLIPQIQQHELNQITFYLIESSIYIIWVNAIVFICLLIGSLTLIFLQIRYYTKQQ